MNNFPFKLGDRLVEKAKASLLDAVTAVLLESASLFDELSKARDESFRYGCFC